MADSPLKRFAPTKQGVSLQSLPDWPGFPDKLKKIDPTLQASEDALKAWMKAMERRLNQVIDAQKSGE